MKRILDGDGAYWVAIATKRTPGCFADLSDRYWIDVRLVYPVRCPVHRFERAQRGCAEVSPQGNRFCGPFSERGCYGGLGGLALQDVEQTLFMAGCRADG